MRVAIVTPMPVTSAIGRVMSAAAEALAGPWDVDIWCPDLGDRFEARVPVYDFDVATEGLAGTLAAYDLVLYAVGDSPWHREVVRLARAVPGLVVLHDVSVTNLVCAMHAARNAFDELVDHVRRRDGDEVAADLATARQSSDNPQWSAICQRAPLVDYVLKGSLGAVVHSEWAARQVEGLTLGEISVAPLPIPTGVFGSAADPRRAGSSVLASIPPGAVLLATLGSVNGNRRIEALVEAVAGHPTLRSRVHVVAAGPASEGMRHSIMRGARDLGVASQVHVPGPIDDDELAQLLDRADICAALRDPVLEAKSASLLTQMQSGTPVMVLDHGHYAELPDDVAVKVSVGGGVPAIASALLALIDDPGAATALGARGRDYVSRNHTAAAYAVVIAAAAELAMATRPVMDMTTVLGARLRRLGLQAEPVVQRSVSETALELLDLD
jgi:glycosyltransferase involved in cell wall biosynthesis